MKRLALSLAFILWAGAAFADDYAGVRVVTTCGNPSPWPALQTNYHPQSVWLSVDTTMTLCTIGGGGGGGGNVTVVGPLGNQTLGNSIAVTSSDGSLVSLGALADVAWTSGNGSVIAVLKKIAGGIPITFSTPQHVIVDSGSIAFSAPQHVIVDSSGLPTGAATQTTLAAILANPNAVNVTPTDCSQTANGSSQTLIAASATIHGFTIANIDPTTGSGEPVWISFTTTAAAGAKQSFPLAAPIATSYAGMGSYTTPVGFGSNQNVTEIATTGHLISCTRW